MRIAEHDCKYNITEDGVRGQPAKKEVVIYSIHNRIGMNSISLYTKQWFKHKHVLHLVSYECENLATPFMTISHVVSNTTYTKSVDFCVLSDKPYTLIQHSQFRNKGPCIVYQINICGTLASVLVLQIILCWALVLCVRSCCANLCFSSSGCYVHTGLSVIFHPVYYSVPPNPTVVVWLLPLSGAALYAVIGRPDQYTLFTVWSSRLQWWNNMENGVRCDYILLIIYNWVNVR